MSPEERQLARGMYFLLLSLRSGLEPYRWPGHEISPDGKELALQFEAVRYSARVLFRQNLPTRMLKRHISGLQLDLATLRANPLFRHFGSRTFKLRPGPEGDNSVAAVLAAEPRFKTKGIMIGDAAELISHLLEKISSGYYGQPELPGIEQLRDILPTQKIAPVQFEIQNGRLVILRSSNAPKFEDKNNVAAAALELAARGKHIIDELKSSNCDRRLIDTVEYLQEQLIQETPNVIRIGLTNIGCTMMCEVFQKELPDALVSLLRSHTVGVEMYVAQFPDWNRFVENAAAAQIGVDDVVTLHTATTDLIRHLSERSEVVDPEVPRAFAQLANLIRTPTQGAKRTSFAILRSIENLISKILSYAVDILDRTVKKAADDFSSMVSKAVIIGLLTLALEGAVKISAIASKIPEMSWMKNAIELVEKQIKSMQK